jgi:hypothetical protein
VNTGGDPTSTLLQNCAGSQMVSTFKQIGTQIANLRISQ